MSSGRKLLSSLIHSGDVDQYIKMGLSKELFRESEQILFEAIHSHMMKFGVLPHPETINALKGLEEGVVSTVEPPSYYLEEVSKRYLQTRLSVAVAQSHELLLQKQPDEAYSLIRSILNGLFNFKNRQHLLDFRESSELLIPEYKLTKIGGAKSRLMFGWPTLDSMTGGLRAGDLCTYTGRPAAGKTFQLLYSAITAWRKGATPLFISMEMDAITIMQRLAAMEGSLPMTQVLKAELTSTSIAKYYNMLAGLKERKNPFWIVDGNLTTKVEDILMLCHQLKPTGVFVDGAYLLRHPNSRLNKWDKMTENAELLKLTIATDLGIPVVASYQLNREVKKKKKGDEKGVEDIYGSDAIGQLSTVSLGLFQVEDVETAVRREVTVLKGRNGEAGKFHINWDFTHMDFSEHNPPTPPGVESDTNLDVEYMKYLG